MLQKELFNIRKTKEGKHIICLKDQQASKKEFESEEEAAAYIDEKPWELIYTLSIFSSLVLKEIESNNQ